MKLKAIIFSLLIATTVLSSCGKYDEGPGLSLASKKARAAGTWTIESISANGVEISGATLAALLTNGDFPTSLEIKKDGSYTEKSLLDSETGKWEFTSSNEKIKFTPTTGTAEELTILKLKNKSMWLESKDGNDTAIIKYKQ